jgi:hypothetical protein
MCAHKSYAIPVLAVDLLPAQALAPATYLWQYPEPLREPDYLLDLTWQDWVGGTAILMVLGLFYGVTR